MVRTIDLGRMEVKGLKVDDLGDKEYPKIIERQDRRHSPLAVFNLFAQLR